MEYEPITFSVDFVQSIPFDKPYFSSSTTSSTFESSVYANLFTTIKDFNNIVVKMVDKNGIVYAASYSNLNSRKYSGTIQDERYTAILGNTQTVYLSGARYGLSLYSQKPFKNGKYDLAVEIDGTKYTIEDAVTLTDAAMIYISTASDFPDTFTGDTKGYFSVRFTGGNPDDFDFAIKDNEGNTVATTVSKMVVNTYYPRIDVIYTVETVDENGFGTSNYEYEVITEKDYVMGNQSNFYTRSPQYHVDLYGASVSKDNKASVVFSSKNCFADNTYKFELEYNSNVISEVVASPNDDGVFELDFKDDDGNLIQLEEYEQYWITIYRKNTRNEWDRRDSLWFYSNRTEQVSTGYANITSNIYFDYPNVRAYVYVKTELASNYSDNSKFKFEAVKPDGTVIELTGFNVERKSINNGARQSIVFKKDVSEIFELGTCAQLRMSYDGNLLTKRTYYNTYYPEQDAYGSSYKYGDNAARVEVVDLKHYDNVQTVELALYEPVTLKQVKKYPLYLMRQVTLISIG